MTDLIKAADALAEELEHIMEMHTLTYSSATEALTAYLTARESAGEVRDEK